MFFYFKLSTLNSQLIHSCDIFADNIKLQVHLRTHFDILEIGVVVGVRDDAYA